VLNNFNIPKMRCLETGFQVLQRYDFPANGKNLFRLPVHSLSNLRGNEVAAGALQQFFT
jgi:hypothetical protein